MSEPISLRRCIERLIEGTIRIPGFQRDYVWEPERAALLMDSLHKGYPVGSILLWRTQSRLKTERRLGVFELPPPDKDFPVDYVLDGQQRLTAIFTTFQNALDAGLPDPDVWLPVFYDFAAQDDAQESQFVGLRPDVDYDGDRYFPLSAFFDAIEFARLTRDLTEPRTEEIVRVQQKFQEALVPVETFESEDRGSVAIVFERVNRMGVELDVFQLLTAWTWSDEFDLQERFTELAGEFADFGFEQVGADTTLMLRCCAAVLKNDPSPASLVELNGAEVRASFELVADALRRAIDYVRTNFNVRHLKFLPYESMLIPLTAFFSVRTAHPVAADEHATLKRWFWRTAFSHRYSGNPQRTLRRDIEEAIALRKGERADLADMPAAADPSFFLTHHFNLRTVATRAFVLLLADLHPQSLLSGELIHLDEVLAEPNRSEFHHLYPRAALLRDDDSEEHADALANLVILSRSENRTISDSVPSEYRERMPEHVDHILAASLIPPSLFEDDYDRFVGERARELAQQVEELID